jgi:hypothetical protein
VSQTELGMGTARTICKKFSFLSREVMGMVLFVTCAAKNKSIDPIFSKDKADATGYVGAERQSVQSDSLDFYSGYYELSRMQTMLLVWSCRRTPRERFEIGHSCLLPNSYLHSLTHFHLSRGYTAYLLETMSLNNT